MNSAGKSVVLIGAGPTGALLAILLRKRGFQVTIYESRPDPRGTQVSAGRSINLALAGRGIHALRLAGVFDTVADMMIPMRSRYVHQQDGSHSQQPYGQRPNEVNYSISRHCLNRGLLEVAIGQYGAEVHFEHRLETVDFVAGSVTLRNQRTREQIRAPMQPLIACDGAGSTMRRLMAASGIIQVREEELDHGYKELSIPATAAGGYPMTPDALHIWPRGGFMLIALPNTDRSFTATLFLPKHGVTSFDSLRTPSAIDDFLFGNFPDVRTLMPNAVDEFRQHATGFLGTVYATPWHAGGSVTLLGDAAHAIVPFHGQGMNCCLEDCVELVSCLDRHSDWSAAFGEFNRRRKPDTDAIAVMALENYREMRERVLEPRFKLQQAVALELERRFPQRFIPRYSMVQFHTDISYRTALERGAIQSRLLAELTQHSTVVEDVDFEAARRLIEAQLEPVG